MGLPIERRDEAAKVANWASPTVVDVRRLPGPGASHAMTWSRQSGASTATCGCHIGNVQMIRPARYRTLV